MITLQATLALLQWATEVTLADQLKVAEILEERQRQGKDTNAEDMERILSTY